MNLVSIITPTYNRPQLLERAIESVLNQTMTDWEMIIIDDSTNSETQEFIKKYQNHPQITYLKNDKNEGLPFSRNRGFDLAKGEWITMLDDDDLYIDKDSLKKVWGILQNATEINWVVCSTVNNNDTVRTKALIKKDSYNWLSDFLFGKSFRGDAVHFFRRLWLGETRYHGEHRTEWYFWYDLSKKSNFVYQELPVVLVEYLPDGMSNLGYLKKERVYLYQQFFEMLKNISTWKYLPIIIARYIISFSFPRKIFVWFKQRRAS